ncbi:cation:proton antiporter [Streptomyces sp. AN091965]|uniref:cation:proton antiporter n=1 Tax=Streptomyces sp. AN091965 TaxID=2927803 RepID=UPI001F61EF7B|nr:cation:proton antiporter [Streptomyces sp. AN091965]MCI3928083.1 cation:proton antiporter [Streptomyces sp. AN091965]
MPAFIVVLSLLFLWSLVSHRLARWSITAPIAFVVAGIVLTRGPHPAVPFDLEAHSFEVAVEIVLAVMLFMDATEAREYERLGRSVGEGRLLGIALPASVALATLLGALVLPGTSWWLLAVAALVVMPVDLAPIAGFLRDARVPLRVRAALNIEGGFNDGLISPLFLFCVANLATAHGSTFAELLWSVVKGALLAVVVGSLLGAGAAWLVRRARDEGWARPAALRTASLALPFLAYAVATTAGGNGFVAAFVTGLWYATTAHAVAADNLGLVHEVSELMALAVWFTLGKMATDAFAGGVSARVVLYGLLALTVARLVPVMASLAVTDLPRTERWAIAWLGSRGVTSIVFALLAYIQLPPDDSAFIINVMCTTVLLSVALHGITQEPVARRFARAPQPTP